MLPTPPSRLVHGLAALVVGLLTLAGKLMASGCEESFYRNAPPQRVSDSGLERRCHSLGDGRHFVSLYHPTNQAQVYMAFRHGKGSTDGTGEDENIQVYVPALYTKRQKATPSNSASPLSKLDFLTSELVESRTVPQCDEAGGDVYVQSGIGGLSEDMGGVLWSAVCCAVPDGPGDFSMAVVQDEDEQLKTMSVKELEELVGVQDLFLGGCGKTDDQDEKDIVRSVSEEKLESDEAAHEDTETSERSVERTSTADEQESSITAEVHETESAISENVNDTDSVLLYVLSSSVSLLLAPFSPVVSRVTNLPSQVCYVLQEDVAVLASLPGDSLSLVQNVVSGVASNVENVASMVYQVSEYGVCSVYSVVSTLTGTLLGTCYEGLTGTGTLVGDVLGLGTDVLEEVWDLGSGVVGSTGVGLFEYLGMVGSEMGGQGWSLGRGVGTLIWRAQRGVGHVIRTLFNIGGGVVGNTVENVMEAFGVEGE